MNSVSFGSSGNATRPISTCVYVDRHADLETLGITVCLCERYTQQPQTEVLLWCLAKEWHKGAIHEATTIFMLLSYVKHNTLAGTFTLQAATCSFMF